MTDRISILQHSTFVQAKTWELDGSITPYGDGKYYKLVQRTVDGIAGLSDLLEMLEDLPRACVIRGAPVVPDLMAIRDQPDPDRGHEGFKPGLVRRALDYFDDQPLHSVCLDVDGYQVLTADPLTEPEASIAEFVTCMLPDEFAGASYHWQLSNTFGHPRKLADGLKVHLWFWLATPLTSAQMKAWAQSVKLKADMALFAPTQPHYTAAPIMAEGVECPVQQRHGFVQGPLGDEVELEVDLAALAVTAARQGGTGQRLRNIAESDPVAQRLAGLGMIKSECKDGYNIECPFVEEHTVDSGETATQYRLPHTGGHAVGQFICKHSHCSGRGRSLFLAKIGIDEIEDAFEPLAPAQPGADRTDAPIVRKGVPEAKHLTTDQANAGRIVKKFGKRMIVVAGQWFAWTGMRWEKDDGEVYRCGCLLSKVIHAEADEWRAKKGSTAEEAEKNGAIADALVKWAAKSEMKASIEAAVGLTKKMLSVGENTIDRSPWLLNCTNGTVDLRTGELKAHDPDDFITKLVPLAYDPAARSTAWETVIARVTLEEGMTTRPLAGFLQRWFGYCATGSTREQAFVVHYGNGSNGKSTILDTVADVLGDYAATAAPGLLVGDKKDRHPTEIADLFGRRMVTSHETGEGGQLKEDTVKQLTGGDKIKARFMRADFFEFDPTHKLQLLTNHKPAIKGQDNGIWRRVLLMPYLARFAVAEEVVAGRANYVRDTSIMDRLRKEHAGVLAWLVRGAMVWAQEGLQPPDLVLAASRDYQTEQDRVGQFVAECCELDPAAVEPLNDGMSGGLYQAYRGWCNEGGVFALSKQRFTQELERCVPGFEKKSGKLSVPGERRRDVVQIRGLRLLQAG